MKIQNSEFLYLSGKQRKSEFFYQLFSKQNPEFLQPSGKYKIN